MSEIAFRQGLTRSVELPATAERVFAYLDDFTNLGAHMAGYRMRQDFDGARGRQIGARVRSSGTLAGIRLEVEVMVDDREPPRRKSWRTVDAPRLLVIAGYHMGFTVEPEADGSRLTFFIDYARPPSGLRHLFGLLLGRLYAGWCLYSMLASARHHFRREVLPGHLGASGRST
jgi:hypothetical protein